MLREDTADCLALANTAILMRLIEELTERGAIARPSALLEDAVSDLESCPEFSTRVEDAIRLIRKELMPRLAGSVRASYAARRPGGCEAVDTEEPAAQVSGKGSPWLVSSSRR